MPLRVKIDCPQCGARLIRKPGGRCPHCGADVREYVGHAREREARIEQIVAVVSTIMVIGVALFAGGCSVIEGVVAYAIVGAVMWAVAKKTFF